MVNVVKMANTARMVVMGAVVATVVAANPLAGQAQEKVRGLWTFG